MSSEANEAVARRAPTEQQESKPGVPKRFAPGQTVCNEKNEKGKLCNGHLKQLNTQHPAEGLLRGDDVLHGCQTCGARYMGPPLGQLLDPRQRRRAPRRPPRPRRAGPATPGPRPPPPPTPPPEGETPEQKKARLLAEH